MIGFSMKQLNLCFFHYKSLSDVVISSPALDDLKNCYHTKPDTDWYKKLNSHIYHVKLKWSLYHFSFWRYQLFASKLAWCGPNKGERNKTQYTYCGRLWCMTIYNLQQTIYHGVWPSQVGLKIVIKHWYYIWNTPFLRTDQTFQKSPKVDNGTLLTKRGDAKKRINYKGGGDQ